MRSLIAIVIVVLVSGCANIKNLNFEEKHHAIYIDRKGRLVGGQEDGGMTNGGVDALTNDSETRYVRAIIENFKRERIVRPALTLTIHVHGGLNTFNTAWGRASRFSSDMLKENQYALFVGWNSGGLTNYVDHLFRIRKGEKSVFQGIVTSPIVLAEDVTRSVIHVPEAWYRQFYDPAIVSTLFTSDQEMDYLLRAKRLADQGFHISNNEPYRGIQGNYISILNPIKFLTAPLVDGLGSGAWDSMLRRTDLVLSKAAAFEGPVPADVDYADTAFTRFLKLWELDQELKNVPITLIGHSMGSIVVNNILARHPSLPFKNIVFMAGAARIKDVENVVVPWMRRPMNKESKFYNLSIDQYREISENNYFDMFPHGSLLHWIDNIFGEVNSFKDRTTGGWWNIVRTAEDVFPGDIEGTNHIRERVFLTRFPIGDDEKGPQAHGDFGEYCFWRSDFWQAKGPFKRHPYCARDLKMTD